MAEIIEEDIGVPEESRNTLEQVNAVQTDPRAPWKVPGESSSIFQNYDDLVEFGNNTFRAANTMHVIVIVLDNLNPLHTAHYPEHKQFFIGESLPNGTIFWRAYTEFFLKQLEDEVPIKEDVYDLFKVNSLRIGTYRGIPIYVPDPNFNHNRPASQTESTTSSTSGTTVITTTTLNPAAAGVVTSAQVIPAAITGAQIYDDAILRQARNVLPANLSVPNPCLPSGAPISRAGGSGATPLASPSYDDAILRQARAAAAAPVSAVASATGAARNVANAVTGAASNAASAASNRAAAAASSVTAPTTVTAQRPSQTSTPPSTPVTPSNVYIYEPLSPGFDRYDFNTGKKVFTPDTGPSRNSSNTSVAPSATPRVPPTIQQQSGPF